MVPTPCLFTGPFQSPLNKHCHFTFISSHISFTTPMSSSTGPVSPLYPTSLACFCPLPPPPGPEQIVILHILMTIVFRDFFFMFARSSCCNNNINIPGFWGPVRALAWQLGADCKSSNVRDVTVSAVYFLYRWLVSHDNDLMKELIQKLIQGNVDSFPILILWHVVVHIVVQHVWFIGRFCMSVKATVLSVCISIEPDIRTVWFG